jgi:hypothetical protein
MNTGVVMGCGNIDDTRRDTLRRCEKINLWDSEPGNLTAGCGQPQPARASVQEIKGLTRFRCYYKKKK